MTAEFVDTNVLIYAADSGAGFRFKAAVDLISRLAQSGSGALSTQVLVEFYSAATRKLGMPADEAEETIRDLGTWVIHRPTHADILASISLARRYRLSWWDALIVHSAIESGASVLWSEDLTNGQKFGQLIVRDPFMQSFA